MHFALYSNKEKVNVLSQPQCNWVAQKQVLLLPIRKPTTQCNTTVTYDLIKMNHSTRSDSLECPWVVRYILLFAYDKQNETHFILCIIQLNFTSVAYSECSWHWLDRGVDDCVLWWNSMCSMDFPSS